MVPESVTASSETVDLTTALARSRVQPKLPRFLGHVYSPACRTCTAKTFCMWNKFRTTRRSETLTTTPATQPRFQRQDSAGLLRDYGAIWLLTEPRNFQICRDLLRQQRVSDRQDFGNVEPTWCHAALHEHTYVCGKMVRTDVSRGTRISRNKLCSFFFFFDLIDFNQEISGRSKKLCSHYVKVEAIRYRSIESILN